MGGRCAGGEPAACGSVEDDCLQERLGFGRAWLRGAQGAGVSPFRACRPACRASGGTRAARPIRSPSLPAPLI